MSSGVSIGKNIFLRLFAMILAAVLILSISVTAFADYSISAVVETAKHGTGGYLNLRKLADKGSSRVAKIPNGKTVYVESMSGTWLKAKYGSKTGFVMAKFIKGTAAYNSSDGKGGSSSGSSSGSGSGSSSGSGNGSSSGSSSGSGSSGDTKPVYENYNVGHSVDKYFQCPECNAKGQKSSMSEIDRYLSLSVTAQYYSLQGMGFYKATARVSYRCPICGFNNHNGIVDGKAIHGEVYSDRYVEYLKNPKPENIENIFTTAYPQYGNR